MEIETKRASLDTLSVTIQALHVNGRQMTLAVFRQLPTASAYNDDGSLAPLEYWGIVRYAIKDEGDLWVVCASGGRLYRAPLVKDRVESVDAARKYLDIAEEKICWWHADKAACEAMDWGNRPQPPSYDCHGGWKNVDINELEEKEDYWKRRLPICIRAAATRAGLEQLPQLFIAV